MGTSKSGNFNKKYKTEDLVGKRFGNITILREEKSRMTGSGKVRFVTYICDCGTTKTVMLKSVLQGTGSCGYCGNPLNMIGKQYGYRTVLSINEAKITKAGKICKRILCRCVCGKECIRYAYDVYKGISKSCGCKKKKGGRTTHGMTGTRFFQARSGLRGRCYRKNGPQYHNYGGRGIVCERESFEEFKIDMYESYIKHVKEYGEKQTSLDRINVNGNYCKDNCRRATCVEQCNNKRTTKYYEYKGEKHTRQERLKLIGIPIAISKT